MKFITNNFSWLFFLTHKGTAEQRRPLAWWLGRHGPFPAAAGLEGEPQLASDTLTACQEEEAELAARILSQPQASGRPLSFLWGATPSCARAGFGDSRGERVLVCQEGRWVQEVSFCYPCPAALARGCIARQVYWQELKQSLSFKVFPECWWLYLRSQLWVTPFSVLSL